MSINWKWSVFYSSIQFTAFADDIDRKRNIGGEGIFTRTRDFLYSQSQSHCPLVLQIDTAVINLSHIFEKFPLSITQLPPQPSFGGTSNIIYYFSSDHRSRTRTVHSKILPHPSLDISMLYLVRYTQLLWFKLTFIKPSDRLCIKLDNINLNKIP